MFMYIVTIISFLLDLFLSSILPIFSTSNNIFIPMFTIISLVIMYPYFNNKFSSYLKYCIIFGFVFDIVITNTLCVNALLFASLAFIIYFLDSILSNNLLSIIFKSFIIIFLYDTILYFILVLIGYINYDIMSLLFKYLKSIILNLIYIIVCFKITDNLRIKYKIKKLN